LNKTHSCDLLKPTFNALDKIKREKTVEVSCVSRHTEPKFSKFSLIPQPQTLAGMIDPNPAS